MAYIIEGFFFRNVWLMFVLPLRRSRSLPPLWVPSWRAGPCPFRCPEPSPSHHEPSLWPQLHGYPRNISGSGIERGQSVIMWTAHINWPSRVCPRNELSGLLLINFNIFFTFVDLVKNYPPESMKSPQYISAAAGQTFKKYVQLQVAEWQWAWHYVWACPWERDSIPLWLLELHYHPKVSTKRHTRRDYTIWMPRITDSSSWMSGVVLCLCLPNVCD